MKLGWKKITLPVATAVVFPLKLYAFCPVCAVVAGAGLGIFEWLGVDDSISGAWLGAFILSTAVLSNNYLIKKGKKSNLQLALVALLFYGAVFGGLYWQSGIFMFTNPFNKIFGVNKIIFGTLIGSALLAVSPWIDRGLRKMNNGKTFINYQKILIAIFLLLVSSGILYFLTIK